MKLKFLTVIGLGLILSVTTAHAGITGFLSGEQESGMNKICMYDVLGDTYTLNLSSVSLCPMSHEFEMSTSRRNTQINDLSQKLYNQRNSTFQNRTEKTGFFVREISDGFNKICVYDVLGDAHTYNTSSVSLCPLNKKF